MRNEQGVHADPKEQQSSYAGAGIVAIRRFLGRLARLTLPPFLYQTVMRFRIRRILPFFPATFSGVYSSFKEHAEAFPPSDYYNDTSLSELIDRRRRFLARGPGNSDPGENDRYNFLSTLVALQTEPDVSILDVGAGFGEVLGYLKTACPGKRLKYSVLELEQVVEQAKRIIKNPEIEFHSDLHELSQVDLVFFGSSFQYFENRHEMLHSILGLSPMVVAICDTRMGDMPAFVTAQVNLPNRTIPCMVENRSSLVEFFLAQGYVLVNQVTNPRPDNFNNFPEPIKSSARPWSLVFKKITP
jgi:putative methyltransferase (TIGR04325 family)